MSVTQSEKCFKTQLVFERPPVINVSKNPTLQFSSFKEQITNTEPDSWTHPKGYKKETNESSNLKYSITTAVLVLHPKVSPNLSLDYIGYFYPNLFLNIYFEPFAVVVIVVVVIHLEAD